MNAFSAWLHSLGSAQHSTYSVLGYIFDGVAIVAGLAVTSFFTVFLIIALILWSMRKSDITDI